MKRWEEQQRKKLYQNRISQAKPTLVTQPKRTRTAAAGSTRLMSANGFGSYDMEQQQDVNLQSPYNNHPYQQFQTPVAAGGPHHLMMMSGGMMSNDNIGTSSSTTSSSYKRQDLPIFQLLKAFKLQQYAQKLSEVGYGCDIYKLALLQEHQRLDLITQLKVLPGHKAKLLSLFDVIDELYPKRAVAEQLKQYSTPGLKQKQRIMSAAQRGRDQYQQYSNPPRTAQQQQRTLINQYESLDPQTKQAFNNTFLLNLEAVKYQIPQLFQQHFKQEDQNNAINSIFPPTQWTMQTGGDQWNTASGYDQQEIQQLVTKYAGGRSQNQTNNISQRKGSNSQNRQQQSDDRHLKEEMAQAMKVIERVNKEFEQLTKDSQQEYDDIKQQQKKRDSQHNTRHSITTASSNNTESSKHKGNVIAVAKSTKSSSNTSTHSKKVASQSSIMPNSLSKQSTTSTVKPTLTQHQSQEAGRFQSNRQLAKVQQQRAPMLPRVIPEHEATSEVTTPQHSNIKQDTTTSLTKQQIDSASPCKKRRELSGGCFTMQPVIVEEAPFQEMEVERPFQQSAAKQIPLIISEEQASFTLPVDEYGDEKQLVESPLKIIQRESPKQEQHKRKLSPLLEREERELLWNNALGHSLDSKQVVSALGYLDLKQICLCLAHAIDKHIQFSQGFYFLDDLQEQIIALKLEKHLKLDFSYDMTLKLPTDEQQRQPAVQDISATKEFEELKEKMKQPFEYTEQRNAKGMTPEDADEFSRAEGGMSAEMIDYGSEEEEELKRTEEEQYIQDFYVNHSNTEGKDALMKQVMKDLQQIDDQEPLDLDYSYSHLEDFLRNAGSLANSHQKQQNNNNSTTTQQLMNTFLTSYNKNNKNSARNSHIQPEDVIKEAQESGSDDQQQPLFKLQPIDNNNQTPESMADSIFIDVKTKEGFKDLLRFQMRIFDCNYDFETDTVLEGPVPDEAPNLEELYYYCKYVIISARMEKEIPILCLVYLERFLTKTGILLNHLNWRRLTLIALTLASKIWDDDSLENVHFPKVMPEVTLKEIASLEKVFLQFLDFDLILRGAQYAKYYFILKSFAQGHSALPFNSCLPPVGPLTVSKMSDLQNNTAKVESELRDKYEVQLSLQKTM